jgi:DAK2 domain fusion protein YloV
MPAVQDIDGAVVRAWLRLAADELGRERAAIDVLNVFPVADSDTGTNIHKTISCAASALAGLPAAATTAEIWQAAAAAALQGACGNSGIILSQLLSGLADTCGPASPCDGQVVALALAKAAVLARAAVHRPVEGTVLTVADAAASGAAQAAAARGVLRDVGGAAARAAREALLGTRQQLQALAAAGVVDAGGAGLCVLLEALNAAIGGGGEFLPLPEPLPEPLAAPAGAGAQDSPYGYEVTFLLDAQHDAVAALRDRLDLLGDSLVVSGSAPRWHVHVHVADAGAAIEAGLAAGRLSKITVTWLNRTRSDTPPQQPVPANGLVAIAEGAGVAALLAAAGANVVPAGPEAEEGAPVAIDRLAAAPGPAALLTADERLAGRWPPGWPVLVVGSEVQLLAAAAVHDGRRDTGADVAAMRRAVAGMRCGAVRRRSASAKDPRSPGGTVPSGTEPFTGVLGGEVVLAGREEAGVAFALTDLLLDAGTEMLTLVSGRDASPGLAGLVAGHVAGRDPGVDVVCYDGGMGSTVLLIGAE